MSTTSVKPLAFIDSGIGGLPYLVHIRTAMPALPLVYVADTLNFPYGPKTESQIQAAVLDMTRRLLDRCTPSAVVVACNTASVVALQALRDNFRLPFIGVVPAVKPAAGLTRTGVIAVMATRRTVEGQYLDNLIAAHAAGKTVIKHAATELIQKIEEDPFMADRPGFELMLDGLKDQFKAREVDTVVLGCTHFLHLDQVFHERFGSSFTVLDSREGVCRRTSQVLLQAGFGPSGEPDAGGGPQESKTQGAWGNHFFITGTEDPQGLYSRVARRFGLDFGGIL